MMSAAANANKLDGGSDGDDEGGSGKAAHGRRAGGRGEGRGG